MKIVGIVSEFNPFHNGHKYLLKKVKDLGFTHTVCVMSGDFVQRGEVAICDKRQRATAALQNGADLVVELPVFYSLSRSEIFAKQSVKTLENLGADTIAFGCECDDKALLKKCAVATEKYSSCDEVKALTNNGLSFPNALQQVISKYEGKEVSQILSGANNTLAIEYIKNLSDSTDFLPIKRIGVSHDSSNITGNIASASNIRQMLKQCNDASDFLPVLPENISDFSEIENAVFLKIRSMNKNELSEFADMTDELCDRFIKCSKSSVSFSDFLTQVKTKRYTLARIKRICLCIFLDIKKDDTESDFEFIRILGMNSNGKEVLANLKAGCVPVNTSLSALSKLNDKAKHQAELVSNAFDVFSFTTQNPLPKGSDFTVFPIIL